MKDKYTPPNAVHYEVYPLGLSDEAQEWVEDRLKKGYPRLKNWCSGEPTIDVDEHITRRINNLGAYSRKCKYTKWTYTPFCYSRVYLSPDKTEVIGVYYSSNRSKKPIKKRMKVGKGWGLRTFDNRVHIYLKKQIKKVCIQYHWTEITQTSFDEGLVMVKNKIRFACNVRLKEIQLEKRYKKAANDLFLLYKKGEFFQFLYRYENNLKARIRLGLSPEKHPTANSKWHVPFRGGFMDLDNYPFGSVPFTRQISLLVLAEQYPSGLLYYINYVNWNADSVLHRVEEIIDSVVELFVKEKLRSIDKKKLFGMRVNSIANCSPDELAFAHRVLPGWVHL